MGVGVLGAARSEAKQLLYTATRRSVSCVCLCVAVCVVGLLWFVPSLPSRVCAVAVNHLRLRTWQAAQLVIPDIHYFSR